MGDRSVGKREISILKKEKVCFPSSGQPENNSQSEKTFLSATLTVIGVGGGF